MDVERNKKEFIALFNRIKREGAAEFLEWLASTDFFTAPASTRFHLCVEGGLVQHSLNVCSVLRDRLLSRYEETSILICALLHDVCKANFYVADYRNKKVYSDKGTKQDKRGRFDWVEEESYRVEDQFPYGHGEKSGYLISRYMKLTDEEAMAIRWHMGGFEDSKNQYAISDAFMRYPLALDLHIADMEATYKLDPYEDMFS
nr:MAG TPA: HD domain [Caudoviricetes sp.]